MKREIFVFGSNLAGEHAGGSALEAYENHGAIWGCGIGLQGNSYAIPTKDEYLVSMSLDRIDVHVRNFLYFAFKNPDMQFNIVAIGCGLAGFKPEEIAPMFMETTDNCVLPSLFTECIG